MNARFKVGLALFAVAITPRLLGAFFLPNTFGDAYVYIRDIGNLSTKIKRGAFAVTDLYGFWLPLYQLISAFINVFVGNGFYSGKIVAALFGAGVCLLVYEITVQFVDQKKAAFLCFLLIALNPLHILTSTSALTDVPHAFFVLSALLFVLKRRWLLAAIFAALAGLTRVESWMLIALIPALQFWKERRVSIVALLIMMISPLFWFWLSWKATGDSLATFKVRQQYHDLLLTQNPALMHFSFAGVAKDLLMLLSGADIAVFLAVFVAAALVIRQPFKQDDHRISNTELQTPNPKPVLPALVFFFAFFVLLMGAYLTHQQPIIFPRYGLILFSLGIPILAWTYLTIKKRRPAVSGGVLVVIIVFCVLNAIAQFAGGVGELHRYAAQRQIADYLHINLDPNSNGKIFCDEGTVRALSGIPDDRFVTSADVPKDYDGFYSALAARNVDWLVVATQPGSTASQLFPWSEYGERIGPYLGDMEAHRLFLPTNIHVYRRTR